MPKSRPTRKRGNSRVGGRLMEGSVVAATVLPLVDATRHGSVGRGSARAVARDVNNVQQRPRNWQEEPDGFAKRIGEGHNDAAVPRLGRSLALPSLA